MPVGEMNANGKKKQTEKSKEQFNDKKKRELGMVLVFVLRRFPLLTFQLSFLSVILVSHLAKLFKNSVIS